MRQIFSDLFVEYFLPEIKKNYCAEQNLDFRILLNVDALKPYYLCHMFKNQTHKLMQIMNLMCMNSGRHVTF
jgi:hypothetical protein